MASPSMVPIRWPIYVVDTLLFSGPFKALQTYITIFEIFFISPQLRAGVYFPSVLLCVYTEAAVCYYSKDDTPVECWMPRQTLFAEVVCLRACQCKGRSEPADLFMANVPDCREMEKVGI